MDSERGTRLLNLAAIAHTSSMNRPSRVPCHSILHRIVLDELNWDSNEGEDDDNTMEDATDLKYKYREDT
jgi:hypothetical protein